MSPIAVVRKWNILMGRVTVVSKDRRPRGFLPCWAGWYAGEVRCVKNCIYVRNLHTATLFNLWVQSQATDQPVHVICDAQQNRITYKVLTWPG